MPSLQPGRGSRFGRIVDVDLIDRRVSTRNFSERLALEVLGGFGYNVSRWAIDLQLLYSGDTHDELDASRRGLSGILWFTRLMR